jgi:hypothetical protein
MLFAVQAAGGSGSGLSAAQRQQLHELGFAVVPSEIPGFHVNKFAMNRKARSYRIDYVRADGALVSFAGSAAGARGQQQARPKHRGFFANMSNIGKQIASIGHANAATNESLRSNSSEHVTPAQEQEMTDVTSDSALIGPIHFANADGCLAGTSDSAKALITNARFNVRACHLRRPDALVRAYKSVVRL